jgi:hypothetical protein
MLFPFKTHSFHDWASVTTAPATRSRSCHLSVGAISKFKAHWTLSAYNALPISILLHATTSVAASAVSPHLFDRAMARRADSIAAHKAPRGELVYRRSHWSGTPSRYTKHRLAFRVCMSHSEFFLFLAGLPWFWRVFYCESRCQCLRIFRNMACLFQHAIDELHLFSRIFRKLIL